MQTLSNTNRDTIKIKSSWLSSGVSRQPRLTKEQRSPRRFKALRPYYVDSSGNVHFHFSGGEDGTPPASTRLLALAFWDTLSVSMASFLQKGLNRKTNDFQCFYKHFGTWGSPRWSQVATQRGLYGQKHFNIDLYTPENRAIYP